MQAVDKRFECRSMIAATTSLAGSSRLVHLSAFLRCDDSPVAAPREPLATCACPTAPALMHPAELQPGPGPVRGGGGGAEEAGGHRQGV